MDETKDLSGGSEALMALIDGGMPPEIFVPNALRVARALALVHDAGLIHGGLTPSNILIYRDDPSARLKGFRGQHPNVALSDFSSGTEWEIDREFLHYMAPEATGRVNRAFDARSDLYSLGCVFFHMLTGHVLFPGLSTSEQIHAHIARPPDEAVIANLGRDVGGHLVGILNRLLAKEPDERYQRAADVVDDLLAWQFASAPQSSNLRQAPRSALASFRTNRLIGRQVELASLRRAMQGEDDAHRLWLVEGPAGIGKTALIDHFRLGIDPESCEFAQGKCEQGDGATPYASLSRALYALLRTVLGYSPERFDGLQTILLEALAEESSMITTIFPEFSLLLGEHTHTPAVSAHAERRRFLEAVARLLSAFTAQDRRLMLCLDDLHWVDEATLEVVAHVMRHPLCARVLFVAAMRDGQSENQGVHVRPFILANRVQRMSIGPLSETEVGGLLRAVLAYQVGNIDVVERAVFRGAGGNPLHTIQFVRSLIDDNLMVFNEADGEWAASLPEIEARSNTSSVVELLSTRLALLSDDARLALQYLAVLAEPSSIGMLAAAMQQPADLVERSLRVAVAEQLVEWKDEQYAFAHDRFREAVYQTLSESEQHEKHLEVGCNLWNDGPRDALKVSVFVVANHLDKGLLYCEETLKHPGEENRRRQFALIMLEAAIKARDATAYESAISYLVNAGKLLRNGADRHGGENADLLSLIELRIGECEFASMRIAAASERLAAMPAHRLDARDRAEWIRLRLAMYVALDQPDKGVEIGFRYLAEETGIEIPRDNPIRDIELEYRRLLTLYGNRSVDELIQLDLMVDARIRNAMDVMTDLIPAVQFTSPDLVEVLMLRMINFGLEYGHCDASCYAYVCLSFIAGARYGDYATTAVFSELAMRLPHERGLRLYAGRVQMCYGALSLPWTGPASEARRHLEEATVLTDRQGDATFAVYSRRHIVTNLIFTGGPLSDAQRIAEDGLRLARDAEFALVVDAFMAQAWLIRELRGVPLDIGLRDPNLGAVDYVELLADCISGNFDRDIAAFAFWTYRLQAAFLWGNMREGLQAEARAIDTEWASTAFLENADFVFYSGLLRIALAKSATDEARDTHTRHAADRILQMQRWAQANPENFLSRERLLCAEYASLTGDDAQCLPLYETAISLAERACDMHVLGVATELAAQFAGRCGLRSAQRGYLEQARTAYANWGADAKVRHLETAFPALRMAKQAGFSALEDPLSWNEQGFETEVVLRAVRALSGEISLQQVMTVILQNALQYAGAERAVLCLLEDGALHGAAHARLAQGQLDINLDRKPISPELVSTSIAYLTLRSKQSVVIEDARDDPQHGLDSYIRAHRSRSIMCVPLVKQGALTGLLYLENALIAGVFNPTRVRTLEVLASQAAVSLENAKLYESVEAEHQRRADAERRVRETQGKLARAARLTELGEFAGFIVHEIGQPITALGTSARAAVRWLNRDTPNIKEAVAAIEKISASGERARQIMESLRAMVRESRPKVLPVDIHEAILEVFSVLEERIAAGNVGISTSFAPDVEIVFGDRVLLQQVIMNLVTNALEAMNDVEVREKSISVQTQIDEHGMVWVSVSDTGPGIAADIAGQLFDSLATTKGYGMGMGLSICKSIVEAHGGEIEVCNDTSTGAVFCFSIPSRPPADTAR